MLTASFGESRDEPAVYRMLERREGRFCFQQRQLDRPRAMKLSNATILMEGCRRLDDDTRIEPA